MGLSRNANPVDYCTLYYLRCDPDDGELKDLEIWDGAPMPIGL